MLDLEAQEQDQGGLSKIPESLRLDHVSDKFRTQLLSTHDVRCTSLALLTNGPSSGDFNVNIRSRGCRQFHKRPSDLDTWLRSVYYEFI
ncbi:hypothetical protein N7536_001232 [Penicillium majusculum]|nr:hypothetical protein N7536_001232 [Penicillium majusculum]